jgi:nitrogen regulatory protein PII
MKRIEAVIRPDKVENVCETLNKTGQKGVMLSLIEDRSTNDHLKALVRGNYYNIDTMMARIEVTVKDAEAAIVADLIREAASTGTIGDGEIFIHPVDDTMIVSTGLWAGKITR